jgi:excinuclease ABC subunit B
VMHINMASGTTDYLDVPKIPKGASSAEADVDLSEKVHALRLEMFTAAENLEFEKAARIRDDLKRLEGLAGGDASGGVDGAYDPYAKKRKAPAGGGARGRGKSRGGATASGAPKKATPAARKRATSKWKPR